MKYWKEKPSSICSFSLVHQPMFTKNQLIIERVWRFQQLLFGPERAEAIRLQSALPKTSQIFLHRLDQ